MITVASVHVDKSNPEIRRHLFTGNRGRVFRMASSAIRALLLLSAFLIVGVLLSSPTWAAATLDLRSVSVPDLSRVVLREMLKRDYVLSPEVLTSEAKVSLSLSNQSKDSIVKTLRESLAMSGFLMNERDGVIYISKSMTNDAPSQMGFPNPQQGQGVQGDAGSLNKESKPQPEDKYFTYKAKARPLSYLTKLAKFTGANVAEGEVAGDVLVFSASESIRKRLEAVLKVVDVPAQAITIRAALIEYSDAKDKANSLGLNVLQNKIGLTYKAGSALANSITFTGATVQAALSAIEGDSRFSYLSQPMLRVLDGESARLSVGSDVPVRGAVSTDKSGNALQSVEYHSSGVILNVSPKISGDLITLRIDQQISSFGATTTSNIDSPSLFKRQASTVVDVKRGQLIVLAGLDEDKETDTHSGLSFLPNWMGSHSNSKSKSQVLLLLEVLDEPEQKTL